MLRLSELKLPLDHSEADLTAAICRRLAIDPAALRAHHLVKRSVDARRHGDIRLVYSLDLELDLDAAAQRRLLRRFRGDPHLRPSPHSRYRHVAGPEQLQSAPRPVVVGAGPCGYFAALLLAQMGLRPLLLERGRAVRERSADTFGFWNGRRSFDPESNAQFGEGGAGTFSDGKLYSQVSESETVIRKVLEELVAAGANPEILTLHRPHIGTFKLATVVRGLRARIESLGGEVRFGARVERLDLAPGSRAVRGLWLAGGEHVAAERIVLAIGHSARDSFAMLRELEVAMEVKPFAVGLRIEHPQPLIDRACWGAAAGHPRLGAAEYRLVHHAGNGRSAWSFCMCPGGLVVGATSEAGAVVTNGMSQHSRNERNANSALVVNVEAADLEAWGQEPGDPLAGVAFQRHWERQAFLAGGSDFRAPAQWLGDFLAGRPSVAGMAPAAVASVDPGADAPKPATREGEGLKRSESGSPGRGITPGAGGPEARGMQDASEAGSQLAGAVADEEGPSLRGSYLPGIRLGSLETCLPEWVLTTIRQALPAFERRIPGFCDPGALLTGVETRTSSPLRLKRNPETLQSLNTPGLYPAGEGGGHAGGILSAAIDGIRVAEAVALSLLRPPSPGAPDGSACDPT